MQCVLIKHCKPNQFLDSSGCLAVTSVCFVFVFSLIFFNFLRATRSIERISYGKVSVCLSGCLSQPVLYQNH